MRVLSTYPREIRVYVRKKKVPGKSKTIKTGKRTNTDHIFIFLKNMLDVMDIEGMKGYYVMMDNVRIYDNSRLPAYIEARVYKPWFFPPYSPLLNPIEEF